MNDITMKDSDLQRVYNYPIYPRDCNIYSDRGFVNIDNGSEGGTHWTYVKNNKSFYFASFRCQPDNLLLNQLAKPIVYHSYKIQNKKSKLCGSYCFYFFYLSEGMNYYEAILEMYFDTITTR